MRNSAIFVALLLCSLPGLSRTIMPPKALIVQEVDMNGTGYNALAHEVFLMILSQQRAQGKVVYHTETSEMPPQVNPRRERCVEYRSYEDAQMASTEFRNGLSSWSYENDGNIQVIFASGCRR